MPRDVDIVREQIRQGKFDYLKEVNPDSINPAPEKLLLDSASSSEISKPANKTHAAGMSDDMRPIYPPSVTNTATTHNQHSQNGSDGTDYTNHEMTLDRAFGAPVGGKTDNLKTDNLTTPVTPTINEPVDEEVRPSFDRGRPSFDRLRTSMDKIRPSFEQSTDFTSAAYLTKVESRQSGRGGQSARTQDISEELSPAR